jgi:hypothetical protein
MTVSSPAKVDESDKRPSVVRLILERTRHCKSLDNFLKPYVQLDAGIVQAGFDPFNLCK